MWFLALGFYHFLAFIVRVSFTGCVSLISDYHLYVSVLLNLRLVGCITGILDHQLRLIVH